MNQSKIVLFHNDQKGFAARPVFKGKITTPEGKTFDVILWAHKSANGLDYYKGLLNDPDQQQQPERVTEPEAVPCPPVIAEYVNNYMPNSQNQELMAARIDALPADHPVKDFYNTIIKPGADPALEFEFGKNLNKLSADLNKDQY